VLLSRKGGTHFEKATRVNNSGGFPYDRHGPGREPVESPQNHDESQVHGDSSRRQIDGQVDCQVDRQSGTQESGQENEDRPHGEADTQTHKETVGKAQETHAETDQETHAQTDQKTVTPVFIQQPSAAKAALFF
jgi:hypothetical protein